jgi:uncharacterized protein YrzB (UPF0473 family)
MGFQRAQCITEAHNTAMHAMEVGLISDEDRQENAFTCLFEFREMLRNGREVFC